MQSPSQIMVKKDTDKKFDVAVIGSGPAGMMAAITAANAEPNRSVVLIEKNQQSGKKFLLTGNGRCNLTNAEFNLKKLVENYNNGEFLFHAFSVFGPKETIEFFNGLGIQTRTENDKRVFPANGSAKKVLEALENSLAANNVKIIYGSQVKDIIKKGKKIEKIILEDQPASAQGFGEVKEIKAGKYIFCFGGKSYALTGSDGYGYNLAEKLGHTIKKPAPALCPIRLKEGWVKNLQGITLENVRVNVLQGGKKKISEFGSVMFTHYGLSGPSVLNISGEIGNLITKGEVKISIDLFPKLNQAEVLDGFEEIVRKYPRQAIKNVLSELAPERFIEIFLDCAKIDPYKIANNMSKAEKDFISKKLKNFEAIVADVFGFDLAMVTRGGVSLKEINHKTMKSTIIDNLFFAGEIIDVDGKTGGFNLQLCWSTGYLAGKNASLN